MSLKETIGSATLREALAGVSSGHSRSARMDRRAKQKVEGTDGEVWWGMATAALAV